MSASLQKALIDAVPSRNPIVDDALRGAAASAVASTAMGVLFPLAHQAGLLGEPPPRKLTRRLLQRLGQPGLARGRTLDAVTTVGHYGYGAGFGAAFGILAGRLHSRPQRIGAGVAFGTALWAASYAGWIPAIGMMKPLHRDRPGRPATMIALHLVFGAVLGWAFAPRRRST